VENEEKEPKEVVAYKTTSDAATVASCEDIVLREKKRARLVLRAKIVENPNNPEAGVDGRLLYQRKREDDTWEDIESQGLNRVRSGEEVAIPLSSEELLALRNGLNDLQALKDAFGVPTGTTRFVGIRNQTSYSKQAGLQMVPTLLLPTEVEEEGFAQTLGVLLQHDNLAGLASALDTLGPDRMSSIQNQVGLSMLDQLLAEWDQDPDNGSEEHWQKLLDRYPFILEQLFHVPTLIMESKAYVGGKQIDNSGGKLPDFLLESLKTHASMIVEIKTPKTSLLHKNAPYRGNAWRSSPDLDGSIVQALTYRDTFLEQMPYVAEGNKLLRRVLPRCAVIIGSTSDLENDGQRRSFERIRSRPDVDVLTFDEMRARLGTIRKALAWSDQED
jgi:hypothetical protein